MEKQMTAERNKRALILQAEGEKQAAMTRAEGEKQASITRSEGERESAILQADGAAQARLRAAAADAQAIAQIAQSIGDPQQTTQYLITSRYIDSLRDMTKTNNSKVIFMPMETSSMLSSIGAIKEVFSETGEKTEQKLPSPPRPAPRELNK
jgi:regulator of protease activity HflC (stomatin/prohibitin superfamily)